MGQVSNASVDLSPPTPYFGGKTRIAPVIWQALGNPALYVEPCFGMGGAFLARPDEPNREIINDIDGFVANFWRAVKRDPAGVAKHADWPTNEVDLMARHRWLIQHARKRTLLERMRVDAEYFDVEIAGRWIWCMSLWIGSGCAAGEWFGPDDPRNHGGGSMQTKKPRIKPNGIVAINRRARVREYLEALSKRLRFAIVLCGDWQRCFIPSDLAKGSVGILLDPPYDHSTGRDATIYTNEMPSTEAVGEWCKEHGRRKNVRIVLAGYEGEYRLPGWSVIGWGRARTWLAGQSETCDRERLWLSPHCHPIRIPRATRSHGRSNIWRCRAAR